MACVFTERTHTDFAVLNATVSNIRLRFCIFDNEHQNGCDKQTQKDVMTTKMSLSLESEQVGRFKPLCANKYNIKTPKLSY